MTGRDFSACFIIRGISIILTSKHNHRIIIIFSISGVSRHICGGVGQACLVVGLFYCLFFSVVQQFFHSQWKMLYFKSVSPLKCIFMIFLARNPCLIFTSWLCECVQCSSSSFFQSSYKYVFRPCQKLKCNRVHCNQDNNKNVARPVKNTCTNWQTKEQAHSLNEDSVN